MPGCPHHPETEAGLEACAGCGGGFCPECFVVLRDQPYCLPCKEEHVRDLRSGIRHGLLDLASIGRRLAGMWLDGLVTTAAGYAVSIVVMIPMMAWTAASQGESKEPPVAMVVATLLMYPIFFFVPVAYEALMLQRRGQTLGKMALGTRVVTPEGGQISRGQAWTRAAAKLVLGSCFGVDYLSALFTRERTCLHDLIARTRVTRVAS